MGGNMEPGQPAYDTTARRAGALAWAAVCAASLILTAPERAAAQEDPFEVLDTAARALFHLDVEGALVGAPDGTVERRHGKAFAISPDTLLTSSHVIGDRSEWKLLTDRTLDGRILNDGVRRAARPINRVLRITGDSALSDGTDSLIPLPAPARAVDAASLTLPRPDLELEQFFSLSLCPIRPDQQYYALMSTAADPASAGSVAADALKLFPLTAIGYQPDHFGGLYAFTIENTQPKARITPWGHAGSPIVDADGNVAAFVSVFLRHEGDETVLATPIQPIVPGTSRLLAAGPVSFGPSTLKCSLSDTVKKIRNDVSSHAEWSIDIPRDRRGKVKGDIQLSYRSVSAEPNIKSIEVEYFFTGNSRKDSPRQTDLPLMSGAEGINDPIFHSEDRQRQFELGQLFIEGRKIEDDPELKRKGGFISQVDLYIYPNLIDGRQGRRAEFTFPWIQKKR